MRAAVAFGGSRRVSPSGLGDSKRKENMALRLTTAPIRDFELGRKICAVLGGRPGTMLLTESFVSASLLEVGISESAKGNQLGLNRQRAFPRG